MKWYKHDANAHGDAKLERVRIKYGMEGYGLYWYCLELIAQTVEPHNLSFELEHDAEIIAHRTGIHFERVQEMMTYMVDLGLFEQREGVITCLKLAKRCDEYTCKLIRQLGSVPTNSGHTPDKIPPIRTEQNRAEEKRTEQTPSPAAIVLSDLRGVYPKRSGSQPWKQAESKINARLKEGHAPDEIIEGAKRYAAFCDATDKTNTEYVMQAATFCGPDKRFLEPWTPPPTKAEVRQDKNVAAALKFLETTNDEQ